MKYLVRRVEAGEWRELRALRLEALRESPQAFGVRYADEAAQPEPIWEQRGAEAATATDSAMFVAVDEEGAWIGSAAAGVLHEVPGTAHIYAVYVAPSHRGPDGPALALMDAAVDFAREHTDCAQLTLGVHQDNQRAWAFYRRLGFTETGKTISYAPEPSERVHILGHPDFRPAHRS